MNVTCPPHDRSTPSTYLTCVWLHCVCHMRTLQAPGPPTRDLLLSPYPHRRHSLSFPTLLFYLLPTDTTLPLPFSATASSCSAPFRRAPPGTTAGALCPSTGAAAGAWGRLAAAEPTGADLLLRGGSCAPPAEAAADGWLVSAVTKMSVLGGTGAAARTAALSGLQITHTKAYAAAPFISDKCMLTFTGQVLDATICMHCRWGCMHACAGSFA